MKSAPRCGIGWQQSRPIFAEKKRHVLDYSAQEPARAAGFRLTLLASSG